MVTLRAMGEGVHGGILHLSNSQGLPVCGATIKAESLRWAVVIATPTCQLCLRRARSAG